MNLEEVMEALRALGKEQTKRVYLNHGAREPLFGVTTGAMKPLAKQLGRDHALSMALYATGNYDAAYLAGMIADPKAMTREDFELWMETAYFYMLSDYVVAVTLAEADIAQEVADKWIASEEELRRSAGWSCYCWLLGNRQDSEFSESKIAKMLDTVQNTIHEAPLRAKYAMNQFLYTAAVSYLPLHEKAVETAKAVGQVEVKQNKGKSSFLSASENIQKAIDKNQLGFKRKHVRC